MPNWQPNWSDVVFDHDAAEAAASMLDRAAARLREVYDSSCTEHRQQSTEWRGGRRREFERDLSGCTRAAAVDIETMRFEASRIRNAAATARSEQWYREQQRVQWHQEAFTEEAARRAAPLSPLPLRS